MMLKYCKGLYWMILFGYNAFSRLQHNIMRMVCSGCLPTYFPTYHELLLH
jgi:hypothetical protein